MGQHFDVIVRAPSPSELIQMGYLCPPRHFGWGGLADWSKLETGSDGDFNQKQAAAERRTCVNLGAGAEAKKRGRAHLSYLLRLDN